MDKGNPLDRIEAFAVPATAWWGGCNTMVAVLASFTSGRLDWLAYGLAGATALGVAGLAAVHLFSSRGMRSVAQAGFPTNRSALLYRFWSRQAEKNRIGCAAMALVVATRAHPPSIVLLAATGFLLLVRTAVAEKQPAD